MRIVTWASRLIGGSDLPGASRVSNALDRLAGTAASPATPVSIVADLPEEKLLGRFRPYTGPGEPEFMTDFLGGRTRVAFVTGYEAFAGKVLGRPTRGAEVLYEHDEWLGTLASVIEAGERGELVVIELGARWAPWLVAAAQAAAQIPAIRSVRLLGVEATSSRHEMMVRHFRDNDLDPSAHALLLGAAGDSDGTARFAKLPDPAADWGATELHADGPDFDEVPCFAIAGLVRRYDCVDLLHVNIQGAEATALPIAMPALNERVRRVVVGTHSRAIDASLSDVFQTAGWHLEARHPCTLNDGVMVRDGTQVWRNEARGSAPYSAKGQSPF